MFEQGKTAHGGAGRSIFRETRRVGAGRVRYRVSGVNDAAEADAEREADRVTGGSVFRAGNGVGDAGGEVSLSAADLEGPGEALPSGLQGNMEQSFGASFSGVRVHNDATADRLSRGISARAFTRGQDMYFRSGEYAPDTAEGRHLIAHELAHVAAGDEGLHRVNDPPGVNNDQGAADPVEQARAAEQYCAEKRPAFEQLTSQNVGDLVLAGTTTPNKLRETLRSWESVQNELTNMEQNLDGALQHITGTTREDEDKKSTVREAQASVNNFKQLLTDKQAVEDRINAIDPSVAADTAKDEKATAISDAVKEMMSSPYAEKFFEAVKNMRTARGGGDKPIDAGEKKAFERASAENEGLTGKVQESGFSKAAAYSKQSGDILGGVKADTKLYERNGDENKAANNTLKRVEGYTTGVATGAKGLGTVADASFKMADIKRQQSARKEKLNSLNMNDTGGSRKTDYVGNLGKMTRGLGQGADAVNIINRSGVGNDATNNVGKYASLATLTKSVGGALEMYSAGTKKTDLSNKQAKTQKTMENVVARLEKTLPKADDREGRSKKIEAVCDHITSDEWKNLSGKPKKLSALISEALDPTEAGDKLPVLRDDQKKLLEMLRILGTSRSGNEEEKKNLSNEMRFAGVGALGDLVASAGKIANAYDLLPTWAGAVINVVGTGIEALKQIWGSKVKKKSQEDTQKGKVETSRQIIKSMAGLPQLDLATLQEGETELAKDANLRDPNKMLTNQQMAAAEEYAGVFNMIESSNVDMTDILYAIQKGEFGATDQHQNGVLLHSFDESMKMAYENLSFTN